MKKLLILVACSGLLFTSCVSKKQYAELEAKQKQTQDLLNTATVKLNSCLTDKASALTRVQSLEERIAELRRTNQDLIPVSYTHLTLPTTPYV